MTNPITIYSDGSCFPNPGAGGWGAVICHDTMDYCVYGGVPYSTNNGMELTAALRALEALSAPSSVILYTDSQYLQKAMTEWLKGWKRRGWKRGGGGKPLKNVELWIELDKMNTYHEVDWRWVKGHNGCLLNEIADGLADMGRSEQVEYKVLT